MNVQVAALTKSYLGVTVHGMPVCQAGRFDAGGVFSIHFIEG